MRQTRAAVTHGRRTGPRGPSGSARSSHRVTVPGGVGEFLERALAPMSRTKVRQLIKNGVVAIDGRGATRFDEAVKAGQVVEIRRRPADPGTRAPFPILLEDEHLIAVEKPAGVLAIATDSERERTLYRAVTAWVREHGGGRVFIVHRLDREVSGVMVFAKTPEAKAVLQARWTETEKRYTALVEGRPREEEGTLRSWLREDAHHTTRIVAPRSRDAQLAVTHWRVLRHWPRHALLEVRIETGRKHQIRAHLASMGCPLAGDRRYGAVSSPIRRLGLHAHFLAFPHPVTGCRVVVEAPVPAVFHRLRR